MNTARITICDIDGTIANVDHRTHILDKKPVDWDEFYRNADKDLVIMETVQILQNHLSAGYEIIFVTSRSEKYRALTEEWLVKHLVPLGVNWRALHMRPENDFRPSAIIKREIFEKHLAHRNPRYAIDDRKSNIQMYEDAGLQVIRV